MSACHALLSFQVAGSGCLSYCLHVCLDLLSRVTQDTDSVYLHHNPKIQI